MVIEPVHRGSSSNILKVFLGHPVQQEQHHYHSNQQWVQNITISKYWNTIILECQNIGISEYQNIGLSHLVCKGSSWFQKCAIGITNAFVSCHQHHVRPSLSCQFRHSDFNMFLGCFHIFKVHHKYLEQLLHFLLHRSRRRFFGLSHQLPKSNRLTPFMNMVMLKWIMRMVMVMMIL